MTRFYKTTAYEPDGTAHTFEAFSTYKKTPGFRGYNGAPYTVLLDGAFLATCESGAEIGEEIEDTIRWFGWQRTCPVFA